MSPTPATNFFIRRWRGKVALSVLLWRDMLGVATLINLSATMAALALAAQGMPLVFAAALHFAPLPYNLFLFAALWRMPQRTAFASGIGLAWLAVMTLA
jgi:hypothetical protein